MIFPTAATSLSLVVTAPAGQIKNEILICPAKLLALLKESAAAPTVEVSAAHHRFHLKAGRIREVEKV